MLWTLSLAFALPDVDDAVRTGAKAPQDAAVVIGIEDYFVLPKVPHADADARAVRGFLRYTRGVPDERIRMLGKGANREQILKALDDLAPKVGSEGTLWVYFAGHGAADPESGERVLLGADTQADQATFQARAVKLSELYDRADQGKGSAVFLLDTCYTGRSRDGSDLVAGKRFAVPAYAAPPKTADRVEWTAAGPGEWSGPMPGAEHGAFTYLALGALRGWADGHISGSPDGKVDVAEAQAFVSDRLATFGLTDQRPSVQGKTTLVLSTATETSPDLSPDEDGGRTDSGAPSQTEPATAPAPVSSAEPLPPAGQLQKADAQIRVETQQPILIYIDQKMLQTACEGCSYGVAYDLVPGEHYVQAKNLLGKTVFSGSYTVRSGEQLRLFYSRKSITEQGRVAAEEPPAQTSPGYAGPSYNPDMPVSAPAYDPNASVAPPAYGGGADTGMAAVVQEMAAMIQGQVDVQTNGDFQQLLAAVKAEGFADRKVSRILAAASSQRLTMAQLAVLLKEVSFTEDREALLVGMQYLVADPGNYRLLDDSLPFSSERQLAASLWGR